MAGQRYGASASGVMIQGLIVVQKLLARNGPSGWYSQPWMSRADQSFSRQNPAMCSAAVPIGIGSPGALPGPIHTPEFQLEIQVAARAEARLGLLGRLALPVGPAHRGAAGPHGGGAPVIGDRHVLVVRQQRLVGAEQPPGIGGVMDAGVEIGVVADRAGQVQRAIAKPVQQFRPRRRGRFQQPPCRPPQVPPRPGALGRGTRSASRQAAAARLPADPARGGRCAMPGRGTPRWAEDPKRQVLQAGNRQRAASSTQLDRLRSWVSSSVMRAFLRWDAIVGTAPSWPRIPRRKANLNTR